MLYTFRPLPELYYETDRWRPWPRGFSKHASGNIFRRSKKDDSPLLGHYGYRGPTHFWQKYKYMGAQHKRYKSWKLGSIEEVEQTVSFFNGVWNNGGELGTDMFPLNRDGWLKFLEQERLREAARNEDA